MAPPKAATEAAPAPAAAATDKGDKGLKAADKEDKAAHKVKPEKPDEAQYKADLAEAEKVHAKVMDKLKGVKQQLDHNQPSKDKDTPAAKHRDGLKSELKQIREKQSQFKTSRGSSLEKIQSLDAQLKSRLTEQKAARGRIPYKNVEEVDREIQRLQKQVESGTMKIVDEKKALNEVSQLNRTKKSFAGFEETEKQIQDLKAQIAELKKGMDNPEQKALSERYTAVAKELDGLRSEQDDGYKKINALRDERTKLQEEQKKTWAGIREVKDKYFAQRNAFRDYEFESRRQRQAKQKEERDAYAKEKRRKVADEKLEAASSPAYMDEILSAEGLIRHFDPSTPVESKALREPSKLGAQAQRTVDASQIKGTPLKKKDEEEAYFVGSGGGKKGKKGRKGDAAAATGGAKFNLNMGIIEELSKVGVDPPSTEADVPAVIEKLKAKVDKWKSEQDSRTKENIAKAKAEVEKLEAEAAEEAAAEGTPKESSKGRSTDHAKKPAQANAGVNGAASAEAELKQEADATKDVAEELKAAKIEDEA